MSEENETSNEALSTEGGEPEAELVGGPKGAQTSNELRIVMQVEVRTDISESASGKGKSTNRITVVNEHIRSVVHVIGGGDLERDA